MTNKQRTEHEMYSTQIRTSEYINSIYEEISEAFGRNANNQCTVSHGFAAMALFWKKIMSGESQTALYPNIKHTLV